MAQEFGPRRNEILDAFPNKGFIIDVKFGNDSALWTRLIEYLGTRAAADLRRVAVYGAPRGVERLRDARSYSLVGWTGYVPRVCRRAMTGTYADTGWMFWGWPGRFTERMERAGTIVVMRRRGQTESAFAATIPAGYTGGVQTDAIESFRAWRAGQAP